MFKMEASAPRSQFPTGLGIVNRRAGQQDLSGHSKIRQFLASEQSAEVTTNEAAWHCGIG
jgi:hypothetical protein